MLRQLLHRGRPPRRARSTTCSPTRRSAWSGRRSRTRSRTSTSSWASRPVRRRPAAHQRRVVPVPAAHDLQDEARRATAAAASRSSSTARRCSPAALARARPRSATGSSRTTGWKPSSHCPTSCSTTPASPPTSGSSPTASPRSARARSSCIDARDMCGEDAQVPGRQAQGDHERADRRRSPSSTEAFSRARPASTRPLKVKVFANEEFGYQRITVERPLRLRFETHRGHGRAALAAQGHREAQATVTGSIRIRSSRMLGTGWATRRAHAPDSNSRSPRPEVDSGRPTATSARRSGQRSASQRRRRTTSPDAKGNPEPDPGLRDTENVPLTEDIEEYFAREVLPHVPDAWIDQDKTKIGYEIPFTRYFYTYAPPRPLAEIDAEIRTLESEIQALIAAVTDRACERRSLARGLAMVNNPDQLCRPAGYRPHPQPPSPKIYWEDCTIPWMTLADVWQLRDGRQISLSIPQRSVR